MQGLLAFVTFQIFPWYSKVAFSQGVMKDAYRIGLPAAVLQCWRLKIVFLLQCYSVVCFSTVSLALKSRILARVLQGLVPLFTLQVFPWDSKVYSRWGVIKDAYRIGLPAAVL